MINAAESVRAPLTEMMPGILVIADDRGYKEGLCETLELGGYRTASAFSARTALKAISEFSPDVALIDIHIGKDNGIELISDIKRIRPEVLCIVVTGRADLDAAYQAVREDAYDYLMKPIRTEDLLATLERCWDLQNIAREKQAVEIAQGKREQELEALNERLRVMVETTRKIVACTGLDQMAPKLLEEFARNMGAEGGSMYLVEEKGLRLAHTLDTAHAVAWVEFPLRKNSILEQVFTSGEPVLVQNIGSSNKLSESGWSGYRDGSLLVMPFPDSAGNVLGIVTFHNKIYPPFTAQDREIGIILGSLSFEAIRAARAAEELRATLEKQSEYLEHQVKARTVEVVEAKDAAESANQEKCRFLSSISHELRTPLNAIIGFSDLLSREIAGPLTNQQVEFVQHIDEGGKHLLELVTDLLDVSKIDAGALELSCSPVVVETIFKTAGSMLQNHVDAKGLELIFSGRQELIVWADASRLLQILLNLLTNAIKFTPENGRIDVRATQLENSFVKVFVKDTGIGIENEKLNCVFEEFQQVDPERDTALGGSGIGLALTRRFTELHGGEIGVESTPEEGSTFWFTVPIYQHDLVARY